MFRSRLLASLLAIAIPAAGLAQEGPVGIDAHLFTVVPEDGDLQDQVVTWRAETYTPLAWGAQAILEYANEPLVLHYRSGDTEIQTPLIEHLLALNITGQLGLHERIAVGVSAPLYLWTVTDQSRGAAIGDMAFSLPINLLATGDADTGSFRLNVVPILSVPTGPEERYLGKNGATGMGIVAASYGNDVFDLSLDIGAQTPRAIDFQNITGAASLFTSLAAAFVVTDNLAVRSELWFAPSLGKEPAVDSPSGTQSPGELLVSLKGWAGNNLYWTTGLASSYTRGAGGAQIRIFAGLGFAMGKSRERDMDGDGLLDSLDQCPSEMETWNEYRDDDGCPDALSKIKFRVVDPNGDAVLGANVTWAGEDVGATNATGLVTTSDRMPGEAAAVTVGAEGFMDQAFELTPEEGEQVREVVLPWERRPVRIIARNAAGDRIDAAVQVSGTEFITEDIDVATDDATVNLGEDGERAFQASPGEWRLVLAHPDYAATRQSLTIDPGTEELVLEVEMQPARVEVTKQEIVTFEKIYFDFDKATIRPRSMALIDEIAATLISQTHIVLVEVQGHTSNEGTDEYNLGLSQRRVESVVEALVARDVERSRMRAVGYGEGQPIDTNDTETGREKNRRVQFVIIDPPSE